MAAGESKNNNDGKTSDAVSVTISGPDVEHARRILAHIAHAADRRTILNGAREIESPEDALDQDPCELVALQLFAIREARERFLPATLSGQAAWDILVALYLADKSGVRHGIGRMMELAGSAVTTGLRYVDLLEEEGLAKREQDRRDGRIFYLILTSSGRRLIKKILSAGVLN